MNGAIMEAVNKDFQAIVDLIFDGPRSRELLKVEIETAVHSTDEVADVDGFLNTAAADRPFEV